MGVYKTFHLTLRPPPLLPSCLLCFAQPAGLAAMHEWHRQAPNDHTPLPEYLTIRVLSIEKSTEIAGPFVFRIL